MTDVTIDEYSTTFEAINIVTHNLLDETKKNEFIQYERVVNFFENDTDVVLHSIEDNIVKLTYTSSYYNYVCEMMFNLNIFNSTNWVDEFNIWKTKTSNVYFGLQELTTAKIAKKVNHFDVVIDDNGIMYDSFVLGNVKVTMFITNESEPNRTRYVLQKVKAVKGEQELIIHRDDIPSDIEHPDRFDYYIQQILAM